MDLTKIVGWVKLSSQQLSAVLLFSAFVLSFLIFGTDDHLEALGLRDFRAEYRTWLGLGLIFALATILVRGVNWALLQAKRWLGLKHMEPRLHDLTRAERGILREFVDKQTRTLRLHANAGVVQGLASASVIRRTTGINVWSHDADYNIQSWAWAHLNKHPDLVADREEIQ